MGFLAVEELHLALVALARLCVEFVLVALVLCLGEGEGEGVFFGGFVQLDAILLCSFSFSKINGFVIIS